MDALRLLFAFAAWALTLFAASGAASGQAPPVATTWGGQAVAPVVPYQPTLVDPSCAHSAPPVIGAPMIAPGTSMVVPAPGGVFASPIITVDGAQLVYPATTAAPVQTLGGPVILGPPPGPTGPANAAWQPYPGSAGLVADPSAPPIYPSTPEPSKSKSLIPPGSRDGVFQKVNFSATYLPQFASDSMGWIDLRTEVVFGLPFFTRETPLVITPSYEAHLLERPNGLDLPSRLNDAAIDFHHFRRLNDNWIADFAVTPGLHADDHSFDRSDAFRITGRGLAFYESSPYTKWVIGVAYLDGAGWDIMPVAGVIYEPTDDVSYELVFPKAQIRWRLPSSPIPDLDERWFYIAAEFGSGIWAIEHSDGSPDVLVSRDYRVLIGLERKIIGGLSRRFEIGYVFNRQIELDTIPGEIDFDDTLLARIGVSY